MIYATDFNDDLVIEMSKGVVSNWDDVWCDVIIPGIGVIRKVMRLE